MVHGPSWEIQLLFASDHAPKNEITCSGLKGFSCHKTHVWFCFGEEGEMLKVGLVYAAFIALIAEPK